MLECMLELKHIATLHGGSGMATIQLQPPEAFNFSTPDEWGRWRRRFKQFRMASSLDHQGEERQVMYCLGEGTEDVLSSTNNTSEANRKKYSAVLSKFNGLFQVRKNVIFERARFRYRLNTVWRCPHYLEPEGEAR